MRKLAIIILSVAAILVASCAVKDGDWDPIKLSKSEIKFGNDGGSATVEAKNYTGWWINDIRLAGTEICYYPAPDENKAVAGEGISATVRENKVTITVEPSQEKREWIVDMEAGDAFTSIRVRQN